MLHENTQVHSITLPLLFPECPLSLGSFDCIDCNEFYVHIMMTIIILLLLLLLRPLFLISAHFQEGATYHFILFLVFPFEESPFQHQKIV